MAPTESTAPESFASARQAAETWFAQRTKVKTISAEATKERKRMNACADALKELMRSEGLTELEVAGRKVRLEVTCKED